ncbi:hypothetical protein BC941DRAFT_499461 [Chlamydoabsidia padenii]|nr:hypothetical protein BC941DRAFT_499461 [Chlamydoabsidia padenii]
MYYSHRLITYRVISSFLLLVLFFTSSSAQSSCSPDNCVAQCQPSCSNTDVCVLSTMSNCGQCPASKCLSRAALGLSDTNDSSNNNGGDNNAGLIGGLVGGLVGGGFLIGGLVYWINKRKSATASLPIVFQSRQHQQQYGMDTNGYNNDNNPRLSDIPRPMSESTRDSACHSITSGVIPIAYIPPSHHMQQEIYQQQQQYHLSTSASTVKPNQPSTTTTENPFQDPRQSQYTLNDDDDDDDDDMSSRHHSIISTGQQTAHQAVQVTRAKPQILRVNTVRVNDLKRGGSVRTILTKSDQDTTTLSRSNTIDTKSSITSNNGGEQDPFQDTVMDSNDNDDNDLRPSRPTTNHSLGSTLGDGEITIFWSGQQSGTSTTNH